MAASQRVPTYVAGVVLVANMANFDGLCEPGLLEQLVADFDRDGFCVIPAVLGQEQVEAMRSAVLDDQLQHPLHWRLLGQSRDGGPVGENGRWQSGKIMHVTEQFDALMNHRAVLQVVRQLVGEDCCLTHGAYAGVRDAPAVSAPQLGDPWPLGTNAVAPWPSSEGGILWQLWHREQGGLFAPHHPRCITSVQCRFQFDDTGPTTTCISAVPESIAEKCALPWAPLLQEDGSDHPELAQIVEPFIVDMWRNRARDSLHLSRPGVDISARAGDCIIVANTSIHSGTVRAGSAKRVDLRVDYGRKGLTSAPLDQRVGDMCSEESANSALSWNYTKIPTRLAIAHPDLVDRLPPPRLAKIQPAKPKTSPGGGSVNSDAVIGMVPSGTCTMPARTARM